jgi:argininosuccinate lyase
MHLLTLTKGLPLTYNRDLQEDKELLFCTTGQFRKCLRILPPLLRNVTFNRTRLRQACSAGYMDATALAEYLVRKGIPFRQAHHVVGQLVRLAEERGCALGQLPEGERKAAHSLLTEDAMTFLGPENTVASYASAGSANPKFVRKEIDAWKGRLRDEGAIPGKGKKRGRTF